MAKPTRFQIGTHSLRARIQLWHAMILIVVVAAFGFVFYRQLDRGMMDQIDADLISDARVLEGTLRTLSAEEVETSLDSVPLELPAHFRRRGRPPRPGGRETPNPGADEPGMQSDRQPGMHRPPPPRPPASFAIFSSGGKLLYDDIGDAGDGRSPEWASVGEPISFRQFGDRREILLRGPHGTLIVVGRSFQREMDRLTNAIFQIILAGLSILALGLVGGWWLAGKAIEPIERISNTTASISRCNLSDRVDPTAMDVELQSLAASVNGMLGRLEHSFDQQSRFTADASHELRTPISVILSHCELALRKPRNADEYRQTIGTCQKAGERMKGLVESLLMLARADGGHLELQRSDVDLHRLATEASAMLAQLADERGVEVRVQGDRAMCHVDADRIGQVILNLVQNAVRYNRSGGYVNVHTSVGPGLVGPGLVGPGLVGPGLVGPGLVGPASTDQRQVVITVTDSGVGIPPESQIHLFDRFYRVDASRSRAEGGNGLGLAICKSIVDAHGGTIGVESQLDQGSTFTVSLPASPAQSECEKAVAGDADLEGTRLQDVASSARV